MCVPDSSLIPLLVSLSLSFFLSSSHPPLAHCMYPEPVSILPSALWGMWFTSWFSPVQAQNERARFPPSALIKTLHSADAMARYVPQEG